IEPAVDASTRNFAVRATLANPDGALRPGTLARVSFPLGEPRDVVVVPQTAVSFNPYGNLVYVVARAEGAASQGDGQAPAARGAAALRHHRPDPRRPGRRARRPGAGRDGGQQRPAA